MIFAGVRWAEIFFFFFPRVDCGGGEGGERKKGGGGTLGDLFFMMDHEKDGDFYRDRRKGLLLFFFFFFGWLIFFVGSYCGVRRGVFAKRPGGGGMATKGWRGNSLLATSEGNPPCRLTWVVVGKRAGVGGLGVGARGGQTAVGSRSGGWFWAMDSFGLWGGA